MVSNRSILSAVINSQSLSIALFDFDAFSAYDVAVVKNTDLSSVDEVNMRYVLRSVNFYGAVLALSEHFSLIDELAVP